MKKGFIIILFVVYLTNLNVFSQAEQFTISLTPFSSTEFNEFCPTLFDGGIVFCSNAKVNFYSLSGNSRKKIYNLFYAKPIDSIIWEKNRLFARELTTPFSDGPASFSANEDIIFFARHLLIEGSSRNIQITENPFGLFYASRQNDNWKNIEAFKYNSLEYSIDAPSLSRDGSRLYFHSDMPGGYGGYDLYYSEFTDNTWQQPVNLGEPINTPHNETFPFINASGMLFFSADGHSGYGKKDIFYTKQLHNNWINPVNLGPEINTAANEYGIATDENFLEGYFSSDREGDDNIYHFNRLLEQFEDCAPQNPNRYCYRFIDEQVISNDTIVTRYEWNFSDGNIIHGQNIKHCFKSPGKYSVTLRVINKASGDTINTPAPYKFEIDSLEEAFINSTDVGYKNKAVKFDALQTYLPDFPIQEFYWDFGEGFIKQGPFVEESFAADGIYEIKLGILGTPDSIGHVPKVCVSKKLKIINEYE